MINLFCLFRQSCCSQKMRAGLNVLTKDMQVYIVCSYKLLAVFNILTLDYCYFELYQRNIPSSLQCIISCVHTFAFSFLVRRCCKNICRCQYLTWLNILTKPSHDFLNLDKLYKIPALCIDKANLQKQEVKIK